MRKLTEVEIELLNKRKANFDQFRKERMPVLTDFIDRLEIPNAYDVLINAENFLPKLDNYLESIEISSADKSWLQVRICYFVGELFAQRLGGCWLLNDVPDSKFFSKYVLGKFTKVSNSNAMIDPMEVAIDFTSQNSPRSLSRMIKKIEQELLSL